MISSTLSNKISLLLFTCLFLKINCNFYEIELLTLKIYNFVWESSYL